jgi:hypothetical protein
MTTKKKIGIALAIALALGAVGYFGYSAPAEGARLLDGDCDPNSCGGPSEPGCFCNRSCFLWYCWGPTYCQCNNG